MKKIIIILVIIGTVIFGYWTISPLFINKEVFEGLPSMPVDKDRETQTPTKTEPQIIFSGTFEDLGGHNAEGDAVLLKIGNDYYVRFEENFKVTNGPDLFVYFGKDGQYDKNTNLGSLKGNIGSQNYLVPDGINFDDYNEVWIWCRAFAVPFGKAVWQSK